MNWVKKGLIFNVDGQYDWNKSHAQCPVVDKLNEKIWRIFYSSRNILGQSQISYFDVKAGQPESIVNRNSNYLFELGKPGSFDDSGVMPTSIVSQNNKKYLYFIGWTIKKTVPYHNSIGIAVSEDDGETFTKCFDGPVIGATHLEPYFTGTAYVRIESGLWRIWYLSCTKWEEIEGRQEPYYHIKYAESNDGIHWDRQAKVAIDFKDNHEGGIVSASVLKEKDVYKMWYGYRQAKGYRELKERAYRIGYAESKDGIEWIRKDELAGIDCSDEGWDSEMMSYPNVIEHQGTKYMFYNGNGFGKTGIGYATLEE
ncbi:MAG: hypothetical protein KJO77_08575 [Bacteroidia bacterium]|nr:hypothetical protein [Bacteroidia bacterium]